MSVGVKVPTPSFWTLTDVSPISHDHRRVPSDLWWEESFLNLSQVGCLLVVVGAPFSKCGLAFICQSWEYPLRVKSP